MKIIRVYSGDDGESHFEEVSPEEMAGIVNRLGAGAINLNRRAAPNFSDYHTAPRRQYVVNLEGIAEFECADGSKVQLEAGGYSGGGGSYRPRAYRPLALCGDADFAGDPVGGAGVASASRFSLRLATGRRGGAAPAGGGRC